MVLGPLIAAGATIAGGLISARGARETQRREDTAIWRRVQDAQRSGVHPVYALGAQGAASSAPSGGTVFGDAVARSGQSIGNALSRSLNTDDKQIKALVLEKAGLENQLLRTQIVRAAREDASVPSAPGPLTRQLIPGQGQTTDVPPGVKLSDPQHTPFVMFGKRWNTNPHWSDAQTIQDVYGEPAEYPYFPVKSGADIYHNWSYGTPWSWRRTGQGREQAYGRRSYQERRR